MPAPRKHPLRGRAIRSALDLVEGPGKLGVNAACKRVGEQLGIIPDTLRNWVVQRQRVDNGDAPGLTTDERARLRELEREVKELRRAKGIVKTASCGPGGRRGSGDPVRAAGPQRGEPARPAALGAQPQRTVAARVGGAVRQAAVALPAVGRQPPVDAVLVHPLPASPTQFREEHLLAR